MTSLELLNEVNNEGYAAVAIRHLCDDEIYRIGDTCRNSYAWNYDEDHSTYLDDEPVELDGTCGFSISEISNLDEDEIDRAEEILSNGLENAHYFGKTAIIAGDYFEYGNDDNEIIIRNAKIIGFID